MSSAGNGPKRHELSHLPDVRLARRFRRRAGGAATVQEYLAAGLLDELYLHVVPVLLGAGERLLENVGDPRLEPVEVIAAPAVTHIRYRVVH
jgi:dihydrofolate reductase